MRACARPLPVALDAGVAHDMIPACEERLPLACRDCVMIARRVKATREGGRQAPTLTRRAIMTPARRSNERRSLKINKIYAIANCFFLAKRSNPVW